MNELREMVKRKEKVKLLSSPKEQKGSKRSQCVKKRGGEAKSVKDLGELKSKKVKHAK